MELTHRCYMFITNIEVIQATSHIIISPHSGGNNYLSNDYNKPVDYQLYLRTKAIVSGYRPHSAVCVNAGRVQASPYLDITGLYLD
jgi:hypothetical protein